ncbi:sugar ABC transporter substrate-binding protein [Mycobacterium antarcticum]|uniref:substrate-binding domain-containing protein n=1 Tax=unclassified Mycolicibacterium TaxID=2636767 RepID=UPI002382F64C|nr:MULTISPECIES: substrate-binding domain-containing protein [unclassified Mycolicibacterium]BDX31299.1 sugar ABC transporter substrate-binding protein [Mycolicibacterium sp. TUM20985]GLP74651.1 sugar ABC transporter substrate-binding protein [Mycolicibacterium sp. TUM20983]GLP80447.1 sugar ABC transporter substrate-binding protein [Mycolicibacterium sp. TUM20984]
MKFVRLAAAAGAGVIALGLVSCSSTGGKPADAGGAGGSGGGVNTPRVTIAMVTHAAPGDTFWDLIRKGAQAAADKDNIELKYSSDKEGPNQANLVQNATDSKVAGIAVTLAQPDAMEGAVKGAVAAGIPVVALNAGIEQWQAMGAMEYFGQDERISGEAAGKRLAADGAKKAICVVQEQGSVSLEARCAGVKAGMGGGSVENLNVNGTDMPSVESTITAKLQTDPAIDHIVTLGAPFALSAVQSAKTAGSSAKVATFDTNAALVAAIKDGSVQWAIDQQPYLQGYLAVDSLWLYLNNKNVIGGGQPTLTGPSFIDKTNIDSIAALAEAGTR